MFLNSTIIQSHSNVPLSLCSSFTLFLYIFIPVPQRPCNTPDYRIALHNGNAPRAVRSRTRTHHATAQPGSPSAAGKNAAAPHRSAPRNEQRTELDNKDRRNKRQRPVI